MYYLDAETSQVERTHLTYDSQAVGQMLVKRLCEAKEVVLQCSFGQGLTNCRCFKSAMHADSTICDLFYNMEVKEIWVAVTLPQKNEMDGIFISLLHTRHHEYKKVVVGGFIVYNIKFK